MCCCLACVLCVSVSLYGRSAEKQTDVPFRLIWNYLVVVRGSIGGQANLNFIVDTGANPSILDKRLADRLHLSGPNEKLPVLNGSVNITRVSAPAVEVGPVVRDTMEMAVQDLSFLERDLGVRIDALIGLDVLGKRNFRIDYESKRIHFDGRPSGAGTASFTSGPPFVTVEMKMENQPVRLLVDTGAAGLILFSGRLPDHLRILKESPATNGANSTGSFKMREVEIGNARLGNMDLGSRRAFVAADQGADNDFDGLLGISPLAVRELAFDFEHGLLTWQSRERSPRPNPDFYCNGKESSSANPAGPEATLRPPGACQEVHPLPLKF